MEVKVKKLDDQFTVVVNAKVTREFKTRIWIAIQLAKIMAMVLGCGYRLKRDRLSHQRFATQSRSRRQEEGGR